MWSRRMTEFGASSKRCSRSQAIRCWGAGPRTRPSFVFRLSRPDLLLDNHLEHYAAGWRLLSQLRASVATAALPIILMSVDAGFLREHCVELLAQRCLAIEKPFDLD